MPKEIDITSKDEAMDFCNKLMGQYMGDEKPVIKITYGFGKKRTVNQNAWYWKWLSDDVVPFFQENPTKLVEFILKRIMQFNVSREFLHEMFKVVYNNGTSTTRNDTKAMMNYCDKIREDMFHDFNININEPKKVANDS